MDENMRTVNRLLGSAAGGAEALHDCGLTQDDTELVARFITNMDDVRARFVSYATAGRARALERGVTEDQLNDVPTATRINMMEAPAFTNPWFLWTLACACRHMASREVVEAAREVVEAFAKLDSHTPERKAVAKLAAALPKEAE